ncbi:MAG: glycosyltransferase family 4 protein [Candidatus Eremiobacteraeota bacterium]|nr:glycosyltransferase family 4 protein [Candidatus Eremiobacteraeota bacterium]
MRVAVISQFYPPEPLAAANRISAMAHAFAGAGAAVHVYTAMPSFPDGDIPAGYRGRRHVVETDRDVTVERVWTYASAASPANRILNWISVALGIARRIVTVAEGYDVVVVSSPPITLALPALAASFAHRATLIVDVRDVFPEVAISLGVWRPGSAVARAVGAAADALYTRAALVTSVTRPQCAEIVARHVDPAKVVLASNGFDPVQPSALSPVPALPGIRDVVYVGNMGLSMGLDVVIDAAVRLRDDPTIRFVLVGGGSAAAALRARVRDEQLRNVVFTGALPRADAARVLQDAAAMVVPLRGTITDTLPTKLFDAMIAGTPIVLSASGEARRVVEEADAGLAVMPEDPDALVAGIRHVLDDEALQARFRANGPRFVRANYDRAAIMRDLAARVLALAAR